jgi:hypothetical protein
VTVSAQQIKASLAAKTTAELLAALDRHDEREYTDQAFEAMQSILAERGTAASSVPADAPPRGSLAGEASAGPYRTDAVREVVVTDIRMPFGSMVAFMVKWTIASIPALIILFLLAAVASVILGALGIGLFRQGLR